MSYGRFDDPGISGLEEYISGVPFPADGGDEPLTVGDIGMLLCGYGEDLKRPLDDRLLFGELPRIARNVAFAVRILRAFEFVATNGFLKTRQWRSVRMDVLERDGAKCACCGRGGTDVVLNVDHIKPRRLFPWLALCKENLQVLCEDCNAGKGNRYQTDWRKDGLEDKDPARADAVEYPLGEEQAGSARHAEASICGLPGAVVSWRKSRPVRKQECYSDGVQGEGKG